MNHDTIDVGVASTLVLASCTKRDSLVLENDSDTTIYCSIGKAAVVNEGIRLNANGGSFTIDKACPTEAIYAIHGGAGTKRLLVSYKQV